MALNILCMTYFVTSITVRQPQDCDIGEIGVNDVSAP